METQERPSKILGAYLALGFPGVYLEAIIQHGVARAQGEVELHASCLELLRTTQLETIYTQFDSKIHALPLE